MKSANSTSPTGTYVLDTSALITYLAEERGADKVKAVRVSASLPFIALTELYYVLWRKQDQVLAEEAIQHVLSWRLPLLTADERLSLSAGYLKARFRLGLADSYMAAFALASQASLVTKDPDFRALEPELKLLYIA